LVRRGPERVPPESVRVNRGEWLRHRCRSSRLEVVVPFRVLPASEVVGALGYPLPVWHWRSQNTLPIRFSIRRPRSRTRLPERSSLEVQPPFTVCTRSLCPAPLGAARLSWDFVPLQRVRHRELTSPRLTGKLSDRARRPCRRLPVAPTPPATVPLTGFLNLSATCLSQCRPTIFRQVALMGFALQGVIPSTKPSAIRHRRNTLLSLLPRVDRPRS
jgi:hypothetical protein